MNNITKSKEYKNALKKAKTMLKKMTLAEKIGQLSQFGTSIYSDNEQLYEDHYSEGSIGSYITIKGAEKTNKIQKDLLRATRLPIPAIFADDVIHGFRTVFPIPIAQSCSWDPELTRKGCEIAAKEAYHAGIRWTYSPMVDIARDPRWGRIMEGYGEDAYLCSRFSEAAVKGYQGEDGSVGYEHVYACLKHFVAYGACIGGRDYNSTDISEQTLFDTYLPPFKAGIDAGAVTVMSAFEDLNGVPCTANRRLLKDILREKLGFEGVVISDAGAINELVPHGYAEDDKDAVCKAFNAGVDVILPGDFYNTNLPELIKEGKVSTRDVDDSVLHVLAMKYLCGLFDSPYNDPSAEYSKCSREHLKTAREAASACPVLLENDGILPLKNVSKIALVGPYTQENAKCDLIGNWALSYDKNETVTLDKGLKKAFPSAVIDVFKGCGFDSGTKKEIKETAKKAAEYDVIIACVGESASGSGEASSMSDINLPGLQSELVEELYKTGKPVVLLVFSGRPLILSDLVNKANAIMYCWQLGTESGDAVADLLSGKKNPSGHLSVTFPYKIGQIPYYYDHCNTGRPPLDNWKFESKYMDCPIGPLYPFGYGKSYTNFEFTDIKLSADKIGKNGEITVSLKVRNTGEYDGASVVQLYIRDLIGSRVRPVKQLKGFEKVFVKAGGSKKVTLTLKASDLAFTNDKMEYGVEPGKFKLWVAEHSDDNRYEFDFTVK